MRQIKLVNKDILDNAYPNDPNKLIQPSNYDKFYKEWDQPFLPPSKCSILRFNNYIDYGFLPTPNLISILMNDLLSTFELSSPQEKKLIEGSIFYCKNYLPPESWGSDNKIKAWIRFFI